MAERFDGFPPDAIDFFDELEANNNREWFHAHKATYQRACRAPMEALVAELEPAFGPGKIFRINRDVRFSADKSPYKTNIAAVVGRNYVSLSPEGLFVGGGSYMPDTASLARLRKAIDADASGKELSRIVAALRRKGHEVAAHDVLKSAPKGYAKDHPRIELLRMKGIHAGKGFAPGPWLGTREAFKRIKQAFLDVKPLNAWLEKHVG
jgi:uncharacterized protein (TIGR02453 family)